MILTDVSRVDECLVKRAAKEAQRAAVRAAKGVRLFPRTKHAYGSPSNWIACVDS